jgi:hypothetical protein
MSPGIRAEGATEVALEREVEGDLFLHDIGQGFGFRPGTFDGAIRWVGFINSLSLTFTPSRIVFVAVVVVTAYALSLSVASRSSNGFSTPIPPLIPLLNVSLDSSPLSTHVSVTLPARYSNSTHHQTIKCR